MKSIVQLYYGSNLELCMATMAMYLWNSFPLPPVIQQALPSFWVLDSGMWVELWTLSSLIVQHSSTTISFSLSRIWLENKEFLAPGDSEDIKQEWISSWKVICWTHKVSEKWTSVSSLRLSFTTSGTRVGCCHNIKKSKYISLAWWSGSGKDRRDIAINKTEEPCCAMEKYLVKISPVTTWKTCMCPEHCNFSRNESYYDYVEYY